MYLQSTNIVDAPEFTYTVLLPVEFFCTTEVFKAILFFTGCLPDSSALRVGEQTGIA